MARVCLFLSLFLSLDLSAKPMVETVDRMEINWATLKIRFYGEAIPKETNGWKQTEKMAWRNGLTYINEAVRNFYISQLESKVADPDRLSDNAKRAAKNVSTTTYSYNTTYYSDGGVRVHLENLLSRVIGTDDLRFRQKDAASPGMIQYSGVVLALDRETTPTAIYQIIDENENILFDVTDMAEASYRKNLMGRWFRSATMSEMVHAVGNSPIKVQAKVGGGHRFIVDSHAWGKALTGHKSLLVSGRVALVVP